MAAKIDPAEAERIAKTLAQLRDIVEPAPPPFWPPALGWYFLAAGLALLLLMLALRAWRHWQAQAYRRQAQRELAALRRGIQSGAANGEQISTVLSQLATLLRRVALHAAPREQLAALSGENWIKHLSDRAGIAPPAAVANLLCRGPYAPPLSMAGTPASDLEACFIYVGEWIKRHPLSPRLMPQ